jgi:hypothetical protein
MPRQRTLLSNEANEIIRECVSRCDSISQTVKRLQSAGYEFSQSLVYTKMCDVKAGGAARNPDEMVDADDAEFVAIGRTIAELEKDQADARSKDNLTAVASIGNLILEWTKLRNARRANVGAQSKGDPALTAEGQFAPVRVTVIIERSADQ